jgi:hypothetical protein
MKNAAIALVLMLLLAAGTVVYLGQRRSAHADAMRAQVASSIRNLDDYAEHAPRYDAWLEAHHTDAFQRNYAAFAGLDGKAYFDDLLDAMAREAEAADQPHQAEHLRDLRSRLRYDAP